MLRQLTLLGVLALTACGSEPSDACEGGGSAAGQGGSCAIVDSHGYPPAVYDVLEKRCFQCHGDPPRQGPFALLAYDCMTHVYFGQTVWDRAQVATSDEPIIAMPLGGPPLPEAEQKILQDWFATCDAANGDTPCELGPGTRSDPECPPDAEGGAGGTGAAGGAGGN